MKQVQCQIRFLKDASLTVIVRLEPLEGDLPTFRAGQYLLLALKEGEFKPFSIASMPAKNQLELHIRDNPGHGLRDRLHELYDSQQAVAIQVPHGECTLDKVALIRPLLFIAGGTGYAPCHAMIQQLFALDSRPAVSLYWGGAHLQDLYLHQDLLFWSGQQPGFTYVPVVQFHDGEADDDIQTGMVHEIVLDDIHDLARYDIFLSGSPLMVGSIHQALVAAGANPEQIYSDMLDLGLAVFPEQAN